MNRTWLAAFVLIGCTGTGQGSDTGEPPADRNGLAVSLEVEDGEELFELGARVDEVVLDARGPTGPVAVSWSAGAEVALIGGGVRDDVVLDLEVGEYSDVTLEVRLAGRDDVAALFAAGRFDDRRWELTVEPGVALRGTGGAFELGQGVDPVVEVVLRPDQWFDGVDPEGLDDELGVVQVDLGHNRAVYEQVLDRIVGSTVFRFPGEEVTSD